MRRNVLITNLIRFCTLILAVLLISNAAISVFAQSGERVTICHYPPGNPDNPQTITVNESAVDAHLEHGDTIGECVEPTEEPEVTVEPTNEPRPTSSNNGGSSSSQSNPSPLNIEDIPVLPLIETPEPDETDEPIYTGQISGTVWLEDINWGVYDEGEPGLSGTRVELINGGGVLVRWRIVNRDGSYSFTGLEAGDYTIRIARNSLRSNRLFQTFDLDGELDLLTTITLGNGEVVTDVNFGFAGDR